MTQRSVGRCRKSCGCSGPGGSQTPSVNVPPLILLFPQAPIRQKGANLMVTVRIPEVSELLKGSDFWIYLYALHCTPFANLILIKFLLIRCVRPEHMINSLSFVGHTVTQHYTSLTLPPICIFREKVCFTLKIQ